jgi:hypothetical protein
MTTTPTVASKVMTVVHVVAYTALGLAVCWLLALVLRSHLFKAGADGKAHAVDVDSLLRDQGQFAANYKAVRLLADSLQSGARIALAQRDTARELANHQRDSTNKLAQLLVARGRLEERVAAQGAPLSTDAAPAVTIPFLASTPLAALRDSMALVQHEVDSGGISWQQLYHRRTEETLTLRTSLLYADTAAALQAAQISVLDTALAEATGRALRLDTALSVEVKQTRCRILFVPCPSRGVSLLAGLALGIAGAAAVVSAAH